MPTYTYEVKGANVQTSFFISEVERQAKESKYFGLTSKVGKRYSDALTVALSHSDSSGIQKFVDWLKKASKGSSKVTSVRKI